MRKRRGGAYNPKIMILMLLPLIALTVASATYALWQENLNIIGRIETAVWSQSIGSSKIVTPRGYDENRSIISSIINNGKTLKLICANISSGWNIWAGILIQNDGTIPTSVDQPAIEISGAEKQDFTINIYYYGPYNKGEHAKSVWGGVEIGKLPFSDWKEPGEIILNPGQKSVIWINFEYEPESLIEQIEIEITIRYSI